MAELPSMNQSNNSNLLSTNDQSRSFALLWLDCNQDRLSLYFDARRALHSIIDSFEKFNDLKHCENFIRNTPDRCHHAIYVIDDTTHAFLLSSIDSLEQVRKIYIFDVNQTMREATWLNKYSKVKSGGVFHQLDDLINQVTTDRLRWHRIGEPLTFSVFHIDNQMEKSSLNINGTFLHFQMLIDLLLRLKSNRHDDVEFLKLCREKFIGQESYLKTIDEFEKAYNSENVLWWYTRETFLYRLLNESLRLQNITWIFYFRFFIQDMYRLLASIQDVQHLTNHYSHVYRQQIMSKHEIMQLKNSKGGMVAFISFLSTTRDRNYAIQLLGNDSSVYQDLQPVLLEITIDLKSANPAKPYGDITNKSFFENNEQETLFMIGTLFRVENWIMEDFITVFRLTQCSNEDTIEWNTLINHMKHDIGIGTDDTLLTLGTLLWKSSRYDQAEEFYHQMLHDLSSDDELVPNCYQGLGFVAAAKDRLDEALTWQTQVLDHYRSKLPSDDYRLACVWNSIGNIYWRKQCYPSALKAFNQATTLFGSRHDRDLASCYNNMGIVYEEMKQYDEALDYHKKAITLRESILPPNHSELGTSYHNIAIVYRDLERITEAKSYAKRALKIFEKSFRSNDPSIASTYQTLAALEFDVGSNRQGLRYLEQAAAIFRQTLPSNHATLENIHLTIGQAMKAMNDFV